jgi:hypothetical protein
MVQIGDGTVVAAKERRPEFRSIQGWAIGVLLETGTIRECEDHSYMKDRSDPHARAAAFRIASEHPFPGTSPEEAALALNDVLDSIGDTCPACK